MTRWRSARPHDLVAVSAISDAVHGAYTERPAIYAERLALYPDGCFVLDGEDGTLGYLISHPWKGDVPPLLDRLIGAIPPDADRYYLHDLALLPATRGQGVGAGAITLVLAQARRAGFSSIGLTAVHGADRFWRMHEFVDVASPSEEGYGPGSVAMMRRI